MTAVFVYIRRHFSHLSGKIKNSFLNIFRHIKRFIKINIFSKIYKYASFLYKYFLVPGALDNFSYNKLYPIYIPTYEKTSQAVHPDILFSPKDNPCFIMAFTPYPFSYDEYENPSILVSHDGIHFFEEFKQINPLVKRPKKDHNNDPDIFYYENKWNILYLETQRPEKQNLVLLDSVNRHIWHSRIIHTDYLLTGDPLIVSPAFISTITNDYIFYVDISNPRHEIQFVLVKKGFVPDFNKKEKIILDFGVLNPWHIDIIKDNSIFYMLICCVNNNNKNKKYTLYIAKSKDIYTWKLSKKEVLNNCYRSTGFIINRDIYIYYSKQNNISSVWEIGVLKKNLDCLFGCL
jgi:hypothetical protein